MNLKRVFLFVIYLAVGFYLINLTPFSFAYIPEVLMDFSNWVILLAAILIVLDSFRFLKRRKNAENKS